MSSPNARSATVKVVLGHPRRRVWEAWTREDLVRRWFGSDPEGVVLAARLDVRVGGQYEVTFVGSTGPQFTAFGNYLEVVPLSQLVMSWHWRTTPMIEEVVRVSLSDHDEGTEVTLVHLNIDPQTSHGYQEGWTRTLAKIGRALANETSLR